MSNLQIFHLAIAAKIAEDLKLLLSCAVYWSDSYAPESTNATAQKTTDYMQNEFLQEEQNGKKKK